MLDEKNKIERFKKIKSLLTANDLEVIDGGEYLNRAGWVKVASYFDVSYEIKHSERQEVNGKVIWKYIVRVSSQGGGISEAEGVASSDEPFLQDKSEHFLSSLAQTRAFNRAISYLTGIGELSAEEVEGFLIRKKKKVLSQEIPEIPKDEIIQTWERAEKKLEGEIGFYSQVIKPLESTKKLDSITRKEIFLQIGELMNKLGLKTPEEKKRYVSKIVGREIISSASLQDDELQKILKILKEEVSKSVM